jgi:hypothetical protein
MANMTLLLATLMVGTAAAAAKCTTTSATCCTGLEGINCNKLPDGTLFNDLAALKAAKSGWNKDVEKDKCGCTDMYEAAPAGYNAAYQVSCNGRLEGANADGVPGGGNDYPMFTGDDTNVTAANCAARCSATPGCGGFQMKYNQGPYSCNAIGVNQYCDGSKVTKGTENNDPPGKDKGLLTSRAANAVFMLASGKPMATPKAWDAVPANKKEKCYKQFTQTMAKGGTVKPEDICVCSTDDVNKKKACSEGSGSQKLGTSSGATATASLLTLAVAAAAATKLC